jgi:hypothetical protein
MTQKLAESLNAFKRAQEAPMMAASQFHSCTTASPENGAE